MDITREIEKENSRKQCLKIVDYVGASSDRFKSLVDIFFADPYRITQRAAWPLSLCVERHPHLIKPHLRKLIAFMKRPDVHDAVKRNGLRLFQFIQIPKSHHSALLDLCFGLLQNKKEAVAIKVFAMAILAEITVDYPELKRELHLIIEDQMPYASPAFRSRAIKISSAIRFE